MSRAIFSFLIHILFIQKENITRIISIPVIIDAGESVHSSAFDKGESWVSWDIYSGQSLIEPHTLYPSASGPNAIFRINVFGNGVNQRRFRVKLNADSIYGQQMDYLNQSKASVGVPLSSL